MSADIATRETGAIAEQVLIGGDLAKLTPSQRADYYLKVCESIGLNPYTKPFDYITLNGKLTLYAKRDCTDQLRRRDNIKVSITSRGAVELGARAGATVEAGSMHAGGDVYVVTARAATPDGREDESIGAVSIAGLKGEALANALMKAETKAKRRVTLSICGLGWLDESEVDSVPDARRVNVDTTTGEIMDAEPAEQPSEQFTCEDCGGEITGYSTRAGKVYTPADVVRFSLKDYSRKLCRDCGWTEKKRREKQASQFTAVLSGDPTTEGYGAESLTDAA